MSTADAGAGTTHQTEQAPHRSSALVVTTSKSGASVLTETLQGVELNVAAGAPRCSVAEITKAASDSACAPGSDLAQGSITGVFTPAPLATADQPGLESGAGQTGAPCDPLLTIFNGGVSGDAGHQVRLVVFLSFNRKHQCLDGQIGTGQIPAFTATATSSGHGASSVVRLIIPMSAAWTYPLGKTGDLRGLVHSATLTWDRGLTRS